ncbi:MAG: iron-containing alcohol dehydrogenase [Treponema sp.]|jgi:alcohol dehydrogenase|nr:iron-containing alcohol dehydrogenase [Treponema sp.]
MDISVRLDPEILIGSDTVSRAGTICGELGGRVLVITDQALHKNQNIERLTAILEDSGVEAIVFDEILPQTTAEAAEAAAALAQGARCSAVIGLGGLITQSIARITAITVKSRVSIFDLLDGISPREGFIPYIGIPTTGRDPFFFSRYFIALDPRDRSVGLIKTPLGLCAAAIIDGGLFDSVQGKFAAAAAFDGFCIALEAYCSSRASFFSDALLEQALVLYTRMMDNRLPDVAASAANAGFLTALGCSVSSPGIGTALAFALNGRFPVEKSWYSTVLLPHVLEKLAAARPEKIAKVASLMEEPAAEMPVSESANAVAGAVRRRMETLKLPVRLRDCGLSLDRLAAAAETARNLEFVAHCPWTVSVEDACDLLKRAF